MLGTTLTITLDGSGGTAKVLNLINQDNYSSEYRLEETDKVYTAKVRHSDDVVKAGAQPRVRHTVTFGIWEKPDSGSNFPGAQTDIIYTILRNPDYSDINNVVIDLSEAMSYYMVKAGAIAAKLVNKES